MDPATLAGIKELGIAIFSVGVVGYILYQVILSLRAEHESNQLWFKEFVNENNHQKTDLVHKVAENIDKNTRVNAEFTKAMEHHNRVIEKLIDKIEG